jgi:hypothetical protein
MIFFCEDCGEKNLLAPPQFKNGKAVFRCSSCHYQNSYVFQVPQKKTNALLKKFMQISNVSGVDQYILVNQKGKIIAHDIKDPEKTADMVFSCGQKSFSMNKNKSQYLIFSGKNKKNIFIFPVGNYYLGVIKSNIVDNSALTDNIIKFLKDLGKKRSQ